MKELFAVEIIFENTDSISIPANNIIGIKLNNVSTNMYAFHSTKGLNSDTKDLNEYLICQSCYLKISNNMYHEKTTYETNFFYRTLKYHDITHIKLLFDKGESQYIAVTWKNSQENNSLQYTELDKENNLIICINCEKD